MIWIDLRHVVHGGGTRCFGEMVISLIFKTDCNNKAKLRQVFPKEVSIFDYYMLTGEIPQVEDKDIPISGVGWKT